MQARAVFRCSGVCTRAPRLQLPHWVSLCGAGPGVDELARRTHPHGRAPLRVATHWSHPTIYGAGQEAFPPADPSLKHARAERVHVTCMHASVHACMYPCIVLTGCRAHVPPRLGRRSPGCRWQASTRCRGGPPSAHSTNTHRAGTTPLPLQVHTCTCGHVRARSHQLSMLRAHVTLRCVPTQRDANAQNARVRPPATHARRDHAQGRREEQVSDSC